MRNFFYILSVFLLVVSSCGERPDQYVQISGYAQSVNYSVKINVKNVDVPVETIRDSVDVLLNKIDLTLSGYNKNSLLSRFNAGEVIRPNEYFIEMYRTGYRLWERSGGCLDFAAAPLYDAWGFGFRNSSFPTDAQIAELLQKCGMGQLPAELPVKPDGTLDPADLGNPRLNYNAIAQGFTCDILANYLYSLGIKDMLVDIGEIWCDGKGPGGEPWAVAIDRPIDRDPSAPEEDVQPKDVWLSEGKAAGITTSGNYRKFFIRDGRKYSHTINPRTGYPVEHNLLSATVVSSANAADSDAIATWCMVVGLQASQILILGDPTLEGYLVYSDDDGTMQEWVSPGFTLRN